MTDKYRESRNAAFERLSERIFISLGLCHYCVHFYELSPFPEKALLAANSLDTVAPNQSHLVHMASHIYCRVYHFFYMNLI